MIRERRTLSLSLSIVIPALGDHAALEQTLVTILENRPPNCEVLVVLNAPYDDPYQLEDEVRFVKAERGSNWAACVNRALPQCQSPVVHPIDAGVDATLDWTAAALAHFADPQVAAVAPLICDRQTPGKVLCDGVEYFPSGRVSRRLKKRRAGQSEARRVLGPSHLGGFYRLQAVRMVGGFTTSLAARASDVDMALQLQHLEWDCLLEPAAVLLTSPELALQPHGPFTTGLASERLFLRNAAADGWLRSATAHPWAVFREDVTRLPNPLAVGLQLLGRAAAWLTIVSAKSPYDRLDDILDSRDSAEADQSSIPFDPQDSDGENEAPAADKRRLRQAG